MERDGVRLLLARANWPAGRFEEAQRQLGLIQNKGYADLKRKLASNSLTAQRAQTLTPQ